LRASASIALTPYACAAPEWAARPVTSNSINAAPLRRETRLPLGRPGSELNTARAPFASASMIGREEGEVISSSEVKIPVSGQGAPKRWGYWIWR